mmetsp:Transcript_70528/g.181779  ORF Transcript_70528/g.181779 Transcript_70528/m.181779 type:complete len:373 (-) Transcript_70528:80-1198(-)
MAEGAAPPWVRPDECPSPLPTCPSGRQSPAGPYERLDIEENSKLRSWKQGESLGRGAYGEVFKAMVAGRFMAVKKIPLDLSLNPKAAEKEIGTLLLEINTLKRLKHKRIVRYHGCIRQDTEEDPALLIFLEYMPSGSISSVLTKFGPYGVGLVRKYTRQILEGLDFLHSEKIVHRDVKGANILIDAEGDAKLSDFGACRELEALQSTVTGGMTSIHGSVYWMAPEVLKFKAGRRSDIWSLGCTVIEMITAQPPWANLRQEKLTVTETLQRIVDGPEASPPLPKENLSGECRRFLQCVLIRDHAKRPYAADLLRHKFVVQDAPAAPLAGGAAMVPPYPQDGANQAWATPVGIPRAPIRLSTEDSGGARSEPLS